MDKYSKTERDKSAYKYFKGKSQDKKWQDEYIKATKDITFDTFTDQLPDIAKKYQGNPYIDKILKLPHINKIKAGYQFLYEGRPLTAISELVKIPKFSSITTDALMNIMQDNPEGYEAGDVLNYTDQLKGKLFIVHGSADDNVHMQNTFHLIEKLQLTGKQFEMMVYPNVRHGWTTCDGGRG